MGGILGGKLVPITSCAYPAGQLIGDMQDVAEPELAIGIAVGGWDRLDNVLMALR